MSEVQKFKQKRKILKAQNGTKTYYEITEKPKITVTKAKEEALGTYNRKIHNGKWTWGQYDEKGNFIPITKQITFKDGTILNTNGSKSSIGARNAVKNAKVIERGYIDANGNKIPIGSVQNNGEVGTKRISKDWGKEFTNFMGSLSSEQQEWLKNNGLQDATRLQEYLNNMKFDVGKFGADGKFGKDSKAAWDRFVASGIMGKNNDQEILKRQLEQKKPEPVVDASDPFGYSTTNHYGDGMALKKLGFNNYSGLKNYVIANQNKQFAKDLKQRFGNDVNAWNQTDVENALGVSGTYRGGRVGDFGDMARSMARWAGQTNAAYDTRKEVSAAKPTFNTQEMLNNIKSLKFTIPEWKFSLNQSNIGASTLGDLPSTKPQSNNLDWMKYAQQTGYLPTE